MYIESPRVTDSENRKEERLHRTRQWQREIRDSETDEQREVRLRRQRERERARHASQSAEAGEATL